MKKDNKKIKKAMVDLAKCEFMLKNLDDIEFLNRLKNSMDLTPEEKLKLFFEK